MESSQESFKSRCWKIVFLKKYHPNPTVQGIKYVFLFVGLAFIVIGIVINVINSRIKEHEIYHYEDQCGTKTDCLIDFEIHEDFNDTVYLFYGIQNFFQNHRRYIKSKSFSQLSGKMISMEDAKKFCSPIVKVSDLKVEQQRSYLPPYNKLNPESVALPCGLIARSVFTDTYKLFQIIEGKTIPVVIDETGIVWRDDKGNKFKMDQESKNDYWIDVEDEHFIVWMRTSGLPDFRKLWGVIRQKLTKGTYQIQIKNIYDVSDFHGHKSVIFSTSGPLGGKNYFLSIAFIVVGVISTLISVLFYIKQRVTNYQFGKYREN